MSSCGFLSDASTRYGFHIGLDGKPKTAVLTPNPPQQVYHVKATPPRPFAGLDLNNSFEEPYTPDKLRSNVERLYTTLVRNDQTLLNSLTYK